MFVIASMAAWAFSVAVAGFVRGRRVAIFAGILLGIYTLVAVLSGHTHGGQLGLLWLGLPHTIVSALTAVPDHGLWSRGRDQLYIHRGTGHYGFPLRLGVPPEESVIELHRANAS